jgi:hypothetical protein
MLFKFSLGDSESCAFKMAHFAFELSNSERFERTESTFIG